MSAPHKTLIYKKVVEITDIYLGPAADRFITRQIENHLHKSPDELTPDDLYTLIDWIRIVVSMITEDSNIIEAYINQLQKLAAVHDPKAKKEEV